MIQVLMRVHYGVHPDAPTTDPYSKPSPFFVDLAYLAKSVDEAYRTAERVQLLPLRQRETQAYGHGRHAFLQRLAALSPVVWWAWCFAHPRMIPHAEIS